MNLDRLGGDLKPGTYISITEWKGRRAYLRRMPLDSESVNPIALMLAGMKQDFVAEPDEHTEPNRFLFGDVLEVKAFSHPFLIVRVFSTDGRTGQIDLNITEFDYKVCDPAYVRAVVPPKRGYWHALFRAILGRAEQ